MTLLSVIPAQAGIQLKNTLREADNTKLPIE